LTRPVAPEDILRIRLAANVAISPDGGLIAFEEVRQDPEKNETRSRIRGLRPGLQPFDLTAGERDRRPAFSPGGGELAFLRKAGGESQVFILPLSGGEAWQLQAVTAENEQIAAEGFGSARWREEQEIRGWFGEWELVPPGLVPLADWRPDEQTRTERDEVYHSFFGGVARKN